jgi:hypothetical protein
MASICYPVLRVPAVRLTKLDACGTVVDSAASSATSSGIITIEQTAELEDRQDYFTLNADAQPCITDTSPPILKWINVTITFCQVDPELYNIATAEPLVLNDVTPTPQAVGFRTRQGSVNNSNFGFEAWTRIGGSTACAAGELQYGYFLLPWMVEGMVGDLTLENGAANFVITARTNPNSLWGAGPYNVIKLAATGEPSPLLVPIASGDHRHMQLTTLPPPTVTCGAQDITPTVTVTPTSGAAPLAVTLTVPTGTLPAVIDWGDATPLETVTAGATVPHTYTTAGSRVVEYKPTGFSSPTYLSAAIVAS